MDNDIITIIDEEFENERTGESVRGITIIIDGKLKQIMDKLLKDNKKYNNYSEIVKISLFSGINDMIRNSK